MKSKYWILILISITTFLLLRTMTLTGPIKAINFPLKEKWATQLDSTVVGLSRANDHTVLARTSKELYALEAQTGKVLWHQPLAWQVDPQPALARNEMVYVADHDALRAFNEQDGSLVWKQDLSSSDAWVVDVSPDLILMNELGEDTITARSTSSGIFLWKQPVIRGYVQAYIDMGSVYIPGYGVTIVDSISGVLKWKSTDENGIGFVDHLDGMLYYPLSNSYIVAFNGRNRTETWRTALSFNGMGRLKVISDSLLFMDSSQLCLIERKYGQVLWCAKSSQPQSPSVIDDRLYTMNGNHKGITVFEVASGKEIGSLNLSNFNYFTVNRQLMISIGKLLIFSNGKDIYAYDGQ